MRFMKIIECPRDAMQGIASFIPTHDKVRYLNKLLKVGFDTLDFGSFVSPKAIPQMSDTRAVLDGLELNGTQTSLLAIVANVRGADEAVAYDAITYLGFPLSISETFQVRNTNKTIADALNELDKIRNICSRKGKKLVTYISMGFGNPYGDPYEPAMIPQFIEILKALGTDVISLADTVGSASAEDVSKIMSLVTKQYPTLEFGLHLHSAPDGAMAKIRAAYEGGCRRIDGALKGYGGCPMAKDDLVGNIPTEKVIEFLETQNAKPALNEMELTEALRIASEIFPKR